MKNILMIGTGGTIASEMTPEGLAPELNSVQLLGYVPEISKFCNVDCIQLFNIDSTNMTPRHWLELVRTIRANYDAYDGFVISHGTDTMAYTAAAVSYLVQRADKPIIFTGSQKPISFDSTDSKVNLRDSFLCASSGMCGVRIVFNGKVMLGTRAKKTRSKSFEAFSSINYPVLAVVQDGHLIEYIHEEVEGPPIFCDSINPKVGLIKMIPGAPPAQLEFMLREHDALIIESFGVGGMPSYSDPNFFGIVERAINDGKIIVITTQVQNEGSDLSVYTTGNRLKQGLKILEAYDMTTEAVVAKLMWILGQTRDFEQVRTLFYTPVAHDILTLKRA